MLPQAASQPFCPLVELAVGQLAVLSRYRHRIRCPLSLALE
jgi:hypothetical protein